MSVVFDHLPAYDDLNNEHTDLPTYDDLLTNEIQSVLVAFSQSIVAANAVEKTSFLKKTFANIKTSYVERKSVMEQKRAEKKRQKNIAEEDRWQRWTKSGHLDAMPPMGGPIPS